MFLVFREHKVRRNACIISVSYFDALIIIYNRLMMKTGPKPALGIETSASDYEVWTDCEE